MEKNGQLQQANLRIYKKKKTKNNYKKNHLRRKIGNLNNFGSLSVPRYRDVIIPRYANAMLTHHPSDTHDST